LPDVDNVSSGLDVDEVQVEEKIPKPKIKGIKAEVKVSESSEDREPDFMGAVSVKTSGDDSKVPPELPVIDDVAPEVEIPAPKLEESKKAEVEITELPELPVIDDVEPEIDIPAPKLEESKKAEVEITELPELPVIDDVEPEIEIPKLEVEMSEKVDFDISGNDEELLDLPNLVEEEPAEVVKAKPSKAKKSKKMMNFGLDGPVSDDTDEVLEQEESKAPVADKRQDEASEVTDFDLGINFTMGDESISNEKISKKPAKTEIEVSDEEFKIGAEGVSELNVEGIGKDEEESSDETAEEDDLDTDSLTPPELFDFETDTLNDEDELSEEEKKKKKLEEHEAKKKKKASVDLLDAASDNDSDEDLSFSYEADEDMDYEATLIEKTNESQLEDLIKLDTDLDDTEDDETELVALDDEISLSKKGDK
jgi:hypothetical protein